jgi:hypothetical protein
LLFGIGARRCWQVWSLWNSSICAR